MDCNADLGHPCDANDGEPCPACAAYAAEGERDARATYHRAVAMSRTEYVAQMVDAGRGHLVGEASR